MFWAFFTGVFTAATIAIWVPYATGRKFLSLAKIGLQRDKQAERALQQEEGFMAAPALYAFIERLSHKTVNAWPKARF
jgi:hypothetical protein